MTSGGTAFAVDPAALGAPAAVPSIVIILPLEGGPRVCSTARGSEAARLREWVEGHPDLARLLTCALEAPEACQKAARDGIELRLGPHQCVLPPSEHPDTGRPYAWAPGREPWALPLAE